jgi:DNA-binding Lrp family transcriptional regulator
MSATAIGEEIHLSRTAVQDRITKMERDGTIRSYTTVVDPAVDSGIEAVLFVKLAIRPYEPTLQWLRSLRGVVRVLRLAGDLDVVVVANPASTDELSKLNDIIGDDARVSSTKSQVVISTL